MDKLRLVNAFVAVVDANGFASGGHKLGLSPPAVTRAINELENHLGVRLLTRTTRVVRVTEPGARYVAEWRNILAQLAEADESVIGTLSKLRGHLTITAPVLFGAKFVAPIVTEYLNRYPEVNASCWFLDRVVDMLDEGVDIGVRIGDLPDSAMRATAVAKVRRVICAAPEYLEKHGVPQALGDLQSHIIVAAGAVTPTTEWRLAEDGVPRVVKVAPRMTTTSNDSALAAVLSGFGITQLLSYQVAELVRDGRLKTVLGKFEPPPLPVHVVHREGQYSSKKARAFIDMAAARLRSHPSLGWSATDARHAAL